MVNDQNVTQHVDGFKMVNKKNTTPNVLPHKMVYMVNKSGIKSFNILPKMLYATGINKDNA